MGRHRTARRRHRSCIEKLDIPSKMMMINLICNLFLKFMRLIISRFQALALATAFFPLRILWGRSLKNLAFPLRIWRMSASAPLRRLIFPLCETLRERLYFYKCFMCEAMKVK